jgi:lipopolysaccharide export system protein LptA
MLAQKLTSYFKAAKNSELQLERMQATGNIEIINGEEHVFADSAYYNHQSGMAHLNGNIKLKNPQSEISGGLIEYDLKRGISRLTPGKNGIQVEGVFIPKKKDS